MTRSTNSDLCQTCGLCCDGTIFAFLELAKHEAVPAQAEVLTPKDIGEGKRAYQIPCSALCGMSCSIYSDRPQICRTYKCRLLKDFEGEKVSFERAQSLVQQVKAARSEIEQLIGAERAQSINRLRFLAELEKEAEGTSHADAKLAIGILEILLDQHFRDDKHRKILDGSRDLKMAFDGEPS